MFNLTLAEVITVLGMCAATYSSRLLGYLFLRKKTVAADEKTFGCGAGVCHGVGGGPRLYDDESRGLGDADCCGVSRKKTQLGGDDGACRGVECPFTASFLRCRKCSVPR